MNTQEIIAHLAQELNTIIDKEPEAISIATTIPITINNQIHTLHVVSYNPTAIFVAEEPHATKPNYLIHLNHRTHPLTVNPHDPTIIWIGEKPYTLTNPQVYQQIKKDAATPEIFYPHGTDPRIIKHNLIAAMNPRFRK